MLKLAVAVLGSLFLIGISKLMAKTLRREEDYYDEV